MYSSERSSFIIDLVVGELGGKMGGKFFCVLHPASWTVIFISIIVFKRAQRVNLRILLLLWGKDLDLSLQNWNNKG